jgi:hypothetical protein
MANTSIVDLNPHFMGLRWRNLDILNHEVLSRFPGNCGLFDASAKDAHALYSSLSKPELNRVRPNACPTVLRFRMPSRADNSGNERGPFGGGSEAPIPGRERRRW